MTVAELIEALENVPDDVQVEAWDGDYQHPVPVVRVTVEHGVVCLWSQA